MIYIAVDANVFNFFVCKVFYKQPLNFTLSKDPPKMLAIDVISCPKYIHYHINVICFLRIVIDHCCF